jgi:NTP pyrophosphatase (non-canonical NTP hydrolase)
MTLDIKDIIEQSRDIYAKGAVDYNRYVKEASRTERDISILKTDYDYLQLALQNFIKSAKELDMVKKNAFYGKQFDNELFHPVDEIQNIISPRLFHSLIGILTEAGEIGEILETILFNNTNVITNEKIADELGDLNWYEAIGIDELKLDFSDILHANIAKLKARYPDKFSEENAIKRNIEDETKALNNSLNKNTQGDDGC